MRCILLLVIFFIVACGPKPYTSPAQDTSVHGVHESDDILLALNLFAGHYEMVMIEVYDDDASMRVALDCPVLGPLDISVTEIPPLYGFVKSWTGTVNAELELIMRVDSYGRIFLTISDGKSEGKSNSIGWRFDPVSAAG